jgi:PII-like signaling protein
MKTEQQQTLMRIYIGEQDKAGHKPLYHVIMDMLREEKMAGATVTRGIAGFGAKSHLHSTHILALSQDLPMIIECVDTQENIDRILPKLDAMLNDGLVTLEKVNVIRYAPKSPEGLNK